MMLVLFRYFRAPLHLHIHVSLFQFIQHLLQPLLSCGAESGACNPTDIVVALVRWTSQISIHQTAFLQSCLDKLRHFISGRGGITFLLVSNINMKAVRFVSVPIGKYHKPNKAVINKAFPAQGLRRIWPVMRVNEPRPWVTKINFIKMERGSIPTAPARFDQGPNCPAYSPACGVT